MGDILQPTLVLPMESWKEEHLGGSLDRGVVRGERQCCGVRGGPLKLLDIGFECDGAHSHGDEGGVAFIWSRPATTVKKAWWL